MVDSLYSAGRLNGIEIVGTASPEGSQRLNQRLSTTRARVVKDYIIAHSTIPDSIITATGAGEDWDGIEPLLNGRTDIPADRIIDIINNTPDRDRAEQLLRALPCWPAVRDNIFTQLRRSKITYYLIEDTTVGLTIIVNEADDRQAQAEEQPAPEAAPVITTMASVDTTPQPETDRSPAISRPPRGWHLSTNAIEWGMLIANGKGEWDFDSRWSAALSLHYSSLNYFTSKRKFRTFIIRPEVRYWIGGNHNGVFIDGHLQMAAYNFALTGWRYRIQDLEGKTPALGGGLGVGYRLPVGNSGRWALEGQIGAGVYRLKYGRYENRINGPLVDTRSRTWVGIDNVALSIVYNLK